MAVTERVASKQMFRNDLLRFIDKNGLYPFLERFSVDVVGHQDDFLGDTLRTDIYTVSNGGGAGAASPVITAGVLNGICDFVTGTAGGSTASSELSTGLQFRGDRGCVMVACLTLDIITGVKVEVGFTDVLDDPGAVNVKATPSFTATDCALWVLDTNNNGNWEGLAANNGTTSHMPTVAAAISPVAATYEYLMVELIETDDANSECAVIFRRFDATGRMTYEQKGGGVEATAQGPNGNVLLTPWVYVEARNATSKTLSLDYWGVWQRRTSAN